MLWDAAFAIGSRRPTLLLHETNFYEHEEQF